MDLFFPLDDQTRQEFKDSAIQIGFEELAAECIAHLHMLESHDRLAVLILAWSKIGDYLTQNQYVPCVGTAVNWIGRYTLNLWFGQEWIACPSESKTTLIEHMMKVYPAAYITMHPYSWPYMFSIYRDPWMVAYLNANFQRYNGRKAPDADVEPKEVLEAKDIEFLQQEGIALVMLRLVNMFDFNMIQLVKHICLRLLWLWDDQIASKSIRVTPNSPYYIDCTRHIYLIAVCESNGNSDLNYLFEYIQRCMQCSTAEPGTLQDAAHTIAKGLQENKMTLMEFLNAFLVQCPDTHSTSIFGCAIVKYTTFVTEYLLRKLHSLSSKQLFLSRDNLYVSLVKIFIKQRESTEELIATTAALSEKLFSAVHNLDFLKLAYEQVKLRTRPEWYTTKLTILIAIINEELNKLEQLKYAEDQVTDELIANEKQLATFYCELSRLLVKVPYLEQESWLTTFSLNPCKEYLECVTKCGTRNLRAIKKHASKLYITIDLRPKRPAKIIKQEPTTVCVKGERAINPPDIIPETNASSACLVSPKQEPITEVCPIPDCPSEDCQTNYPAAVCPTTACPTTAYPTAVCQRSTYPTTACLPDLNKPVETITDPCTSAAFLASLARQVNPETNDTVAAEDKSENLPKSTPKKRGPKRNNNNSNRKLENSQAPKTLIKGKGRRKPNGKPSQTLIERQKAKEERALKSLIVKAIIAKPDDKDKDSAEVLFSAAAGASDILSKQTEESIKYTPFALINSVTDTEDLIKFTDYENEVVQYNELNRVLSNLRLKNSVYDDILALIISPRYKRLTWAICWKILRMRCRELLTKEPKKRQLVQQSMADANDRLTHLDIDYDKYKDKPQIDYGTIEGGYECFETDSGEDLKPVVVGAPQITKGTAKKSAARSRRPKLVTDLFTEITRTKLSSPIFLSKPLYICCRGDSKTPRLSLSVCPISCGSPIVPPQRSQSRVVSSDSNLSSPPCVANTTPRPQLQQRTLLELLTGHAAPMNSRTHGASMSAPEPSRSSTQQRRADVSQQLLNMLSSDGIQIQSTISSIPSTPVGIGAMEIPEACATGGGQKSPNSISAFTKNYPPQDPMQPSTSRSILQQQLSKPSTSRQAYLESTKNQPNDLTGHNWLLREQQFNLADLTAQQATLQSCAVSTVDSEPKQATATVSPTRQPMDPQMCVRPAINEIEYDDSLGIDDTLLSELIPSTASNTIQLRKELGITSSMLNSIYPPVSWHETADGKKVIDCRFQDPRAVLCLVEAAIANITKPLSVSFTRFNLLLAKWKEMWATEQSAAPQMSPSRSHDRPTIIADVMLSKGSEYTISATRMDMISPTAFSKAQKPKHQQQRKRLASSEVIEIKRPKVQKPRKRTAETAGSIPSQKPKMGTSARKPRKPATTKRIQPCNTTVVTVKAIIDELRQQKSAELSNENVPMPDAFEAQASERTDPTIASEVNFIDTLPIMPAAAISGTLREPTAANVNVPSVHVDVVEAQAIDCTSVDAAYPEVAVPIQYNAEAADSVESPQTTIQINSETLPAVSANVSAFEAATPDFIPTVGANVGVLAEKSTVPTDVATESKSEIDTSVVPAVTSNADAPKTQHETESAGPIPDEVLVETTASDVPVSGVESSVIANKTLLPIEVAINTSKVPSNGNDATSAQASVKPTSAAPSIIESPETALQSDGSTTDTAIRTAIEATGDASLVSSDFFESSPNVSAAFVSSLLTDYIDALEVQDVQAAIEEATTDTIFSVATAGELFDIDSLAKELVGDDQSVSTSEAVVSTVADIPLVRESPNASSSLVTTSESAFVEQTPARGMQTSDILAADTAYAETSVTQLASSVYDILHDQGKVFNNNLLHPRLKTYGSNRGSFRSEKQHTTTNSTVSNVSDITIATTLALTIASSSNNTMTKPPISTTTTNTTCSMMNIDRLTGATPSQLIMPYPFDVVTSLLFQHANTNDSSLPSSSMSSAAAPSPIQEKTKSIMEGLACKLKQQFVKQQHELLNMKLNSPDDDIAIILLGRLLVDGDEQTISSFPNRDICMDLEISAPTFSSSNIQTELSINLGEPEHRAHIVKLTMSGKTTSKDGLSTLLNEFARSRLRAGSPTIYSPAVSLKEVKSGKSHRSTWLEDYNEENFKWVLSTERIPPTHIKHMLPGIDTGASSTVSAGITATMVATNEYECSNFGDSQDIGAVSTSALEYDIFSDVNEQGTEREHSCPQESANENKPDEVEDLEELVTPNKDVTACTHPASEEPRETDNEEMTSSTDSASEGEQNTNFANKKIVKCTHPASEGTANEMEMVVRTAAAEETKAVEPANEEMVACTDSLSDEANNKVNKEMIVCAASASEETKAVESANEEMVACTDSASDETNDEEKKMIAGTDSASDEIAAVDTAKKEMVASTDSATEEKQTVHDIGDKQPDDEYQIPTERIDTKQEVLPQPQAVRAPSNDNSPRSDLSKTQMYPEDDIAAKENVPDSDVQQNVLTCSDAKEENSLQRSTGNENSAEQKDHPESDQLGKEPNADNPESLKKEAAEASCEKEEQQFQMEEEQSNSDVEKSRQPSIAFSSDRDSPSTSYAAALKRENRKTANRKSAPVRKASTRNVDRKMRQKKKAREEDIYECAIANDSDDDDDDDGSDYAPRKSRAKVVRPMKLRCIRRSYVAELGTESSSCSSTAPARNKRVFASKSTSKRQVVSRCSNRKSSLASTSRITASEKAALERYNCRELQVVIPTLTAKDADIWCRKSRVVLFRYPIEEENSSSQEDNDVPIDFECPVDMVVDPDDDCGPAEDPLSVNDQADGNQFPEDALKGKLRLIIPFPLPAPASDSSDESEEEEEEDDEEEEDIALDPPRRSSSDSSDDDDDDDSPAPSRAPIGYCLTWCRNPKTGSTSARGSAYDNTADENRVSSTTDDADYVPREKSDENNNNNNSKRATSKLIAIPNHSVNISNEVITSIPLEMVDVDPLADKVKVPIRNFGASFSVALGVTGAATPQIRSALVNREHSYSNAPTTYNRIRTFNSLRYIADSHVRDGPTDNDDNNEMIHSGTNNANVDGAMIAGTGSAGAGNTAESSSAGGINAGANDAEPSDAGANNAGTSSAGTNSAGARNAEATSAGANSAGASSAGTNSTGASSTGANSAGASSSGANSAGASSAGTNSAGASNAAASSAGTSSAGASNAATKTTASTSSAGTSTTGMDTGVTNTATLSNIRDAACMVSSSSFIDRDDIGTAAENTTVDNDATNTGDIEDQAAAHPVKVSDYEAECTPDELATGALNTTVVLNSTGTVNTAATNDTDAAGEGILSSNTQRDVEDVNADLINNAESTGLESSATAAPNIYIPKQPVMDCGNEVECTPPSNTSAVANNTTSAASGSSPSAGNSAAATITDAESDPNAAAREDTSSVGYVTDAGSNQNAAARKATSTVGHVTDVGNDSHAAVREASSSVRHSTDVGSDSNAAFREANTFMGDNTDTAWITTDVASYTTAATINTTVASINATPADSDTYAASNTTTEAAGNATDSDSDNIPAAILAFIEEIEQTADSIANSASLCRLSNVYGNVDLPTDADNHELSTCNINIPCCDNVDLDKEAESMPDGKSTPAENLPAPSCEIDDQVENCIADNLTVATNNTTTVHGDICERVVNQGQTGKQTADSIVASSSTEREENYTNVADTTNILNDAAVAGNISQDIANLEESSSESEVEWMPYENVAVVLNATVAKNRPVAENTSAVVNVDSNNDEEESPTAVPNRDPIDFAREIVAHLHGCDKATAASDSTDEEIECFENTEYVSSYDEESDTGSSDHCDKDDDSNRETGVTGVQTDDSESINSDETDKEPKVIVLLCSNTEETVNDNSSSTRDTHTETVTVSDNDDDSESSESTDADEDSNNSNVQESEDSTDSDTEAIDDDRKITNDGTANNVVESTDSDGSNSSDRSEIMPIDYICSGNRGNAQRGDDVVEKVNTTVRRPCPFVDENSNSAMKRNRSDRRNSSDNSQHSNVCRRMAQNGPSTSTSVGNRNNILKSQRGSDVGSANNSVRRTCPFVDEDSNPAVKRNRSDRSNSSDNAQHSNVSRGMVPSTSTSVRNRDDTDDVPHCSGVRSTNGSALIDHDYPTAVMRGVPYAKIRRGRNLDGNWNSSDDDESLSRSPHHPQQQQSPQQPHNEESNRMRFSINNGNTDNIYKMFQPDIDRMDPPEIITFEKKVYGHNIGPFRANIMNASEEHDPGPEQIGDFYQLPQNPRQREFIPSLQQSGQQHMIPTVSQPVPYTTPPHASQQQRIYHPHRNPIHTHTHTQQTESYLEHLPIVSGAEQHQMISISRQNQIVTYPSPLQTSTYSSQTRMAPSSRQQELDAYLGQQQMPMPSTLPPPATYSSSRHIQSGSYLRPQLTSPYSVAPHMIPRSQIFSNSHPPCVCQQQMFQQQISPTAPQQSRYSNMPPMMYSSEPPHTLSNLNQMQTFSRARPPNINPYSSRQQIIAPQSGQYSTAPVTGTSTRFFDTNRNSTFNDPNPRVPQSPPIQVPQPTSSGATKLPINYVLAFIRQDMIPVFDEYYDNANVRREPIRRLQALRPPTEMSSNEMQQSFLAHMYQRFSPMAASQNAPSTSHHHRQSQPQPQSQHQSQPQPQPQPQQRSQLRPVHVLPPEYLTEWNQHFNEITRNSGTPAREEASPDDHPYALRFPWIDPQWSSYSNTDSK